jgi:pimeloyl-ACP methyl ester carboxylesterase
VTDELREVLRVADMPTPYLLVGHSLGGLYARHYAQRFHNEVAGLVLLDPAHEDYDAYMPQQLNEMRKANNLYQILNLAIAGSPVAHLGFPAPANWRYRVLYRGLFAQEMADWPEEVREVLIERHVSPEWLGVGLREASNVDKLYDEVRHAGPMPDVPLIVLCSIRTDGFKQAVSSGESESLLREEIEGKRRLYADMASSVPRGEIRLVEAGHVTMPFRCPDAVLQAIQDLLSILAGERS